MIFSKKMFFLPKQHLLNKKVKLTDQHCLVLMVLFQLLHADVVDLEFLGKFTVDPKHCLLLLIYSPLTFIHI